MVALCSSAICVSRPVSAIAGASALTSTSVAIRSFASDLVRPLTPAFAAIDNVTRKLMQSGQRPLTVGLYFSLGYSTVVFLASVEIAIAASALERQFQDARELGGLIGTIVSFRFLFAIANIRVLAAI